MEAIGNNILYVCALACFLLDAFGVGARVKWVSLGFACLVGTLLV